jgi:hypothetical protein
MAFSGLYVVGGQQPSLRPLYSMPGWYRYKKGLVMHVDLASQQVTQTLEYESPPEVCAPEDPAILFKSGVIMDEKLYLCTQTEVLIYSVPDFAQLHYVSLPQFNDVHHVRPTPHGTLLVVNTGLDQMVEISLDGEVRREWSVVGEDTWSRFDRSVDYRTLASTKPHTAHPNYSFTAGEDIWVTRFEQRDAICLTQPGKRIHIGLERMHDGVVDGEWVYFTTVDGKVAVASLETLQVEEIIDLNEIPPTGDLLGWCRGLLIDDGKVWIGFTRLRATKIRENVSWITKGFKRIRPARISCYDLRARSLVANVELEEHGCNTVFSILPDVPSVAALKPDQPSVGAVQR